MLHSLYCDVLDGQHNTLSHMFCILQWGLYCPPLIPAGIWWNLVNSWNSIGIKFGRGACQIHTMIPTESWIKFKFRWNGSGNHLDRMHRNRICSYNAYNTNTLNPTSPLPPSSSTTTIQHAASPLSPTATTIHGLHPLPSMTTAGPRCSNDTPMPRHSLTHHTANERPWERPLPPLRRPVHVEREEVCDTWTEQVREPHLNHTHTL